MRTVRQDLARSLVSPRHLRNYLARRVPPRGEPPVQPRRFDQIPFGTTRYPGKRFTAVTVIYVDTSPNFVTAAEASPADGWAGPYPDSLDAGPRPNYDAKADECTLDVMCWSPRAV
jgi:hypothetical protein